MHHALTVPEIATMICMDVDRPTLLHIAQTTGATFGAVALTRLWASQTSILPLLKTLPQDIWVQHESGEFSIVREITATDWARPKEVAQRIEAMHCQRFPSAEVALAVKVALGNSGPLLPRLKTLFFTAHSQNLAWFSLLVHASSLSRLELGLDKLEVELCPPLIHSIAMSNFRLHHIQILFHEDNNDVGAAVSQLVSTLPDTLVSASLPLIGFSDLIHLGGLPNLRSLEMVNTNAVPPSSDRRLPSFPNLDELLISTANFDFAMLALAPLSGQLRDLDITLGPLELLTFEDLQKLYIAVAHSCLHTLSWLNLRVGSVNGVAGPTVGFTFVRPFLTFGLLSSVDIEVPGELDLDDAAAWALAGAWPRLHFLALRCSYGVPKMTLDALVAFATHCHNLKSLTFGLDASNVPSLIHPPPTLKYLQEFSPGKLSLLPSTIYKVATFLSALFPIGVTVSTTTDKWHDIVEWLPHLRQIREEERSLR
ncbi:hypothetical protein B0H11DRAFT_2240386 [Mycena galericulata]|nr:hypothetical protein B0H11DRAFT_2240386 [Mycena galericulata]